jgi:hypothetical protein
MRLLTLLHCYICCCFCFCSCSCTHTNKFPVTPQSLTPSIPPLPPPPTEGADKEGGGVGAEGGGVDAAGLVSSTDSGISATAVEKHLTRLLTTITSDLCRAGCIDIDKSTQVLSLTINLSILLSFNTNLLYLYLSCCLLILISYISIYLTVF